MHQPRLRFLFVTLGHIESGFYARVGDELVARGHDAAHVTYSRWSARSLAAQGRTAVCFPDRMASVDRSEIEALRRRGPAAYGVASWSDLYGTDAVCDGRAEERCVDWACRHVLAMERIFAAWRPTVVVPEVGNETIRVAAHLVGLRHRIPVFFLFHTLFPNPLRLCIDDMHGPIAPFESLHRLTPAQRAEVERFSAEFLERDMPIRPYRSTRITRHRVRMLFRHLAVRFSTDHDNPYLRPIGWVGRDVRNALRARAARFLYDDPPVERPYVFFPLHVVDDYKLRRIVPQWADQVAIVERVARALPAGFEVVVKEHPLSIGRNELGMLKALRRIPNVRLVEPHVSANRLAAGATAVTVISSTVGIEALLAGRPVLTLGSPFYAGVGVTIDVTESGDIDRAVREVLEFEPDRERIAEFLCAAMETCYPGAPVLVDDSDENAITLASSLERAGRLTWSERTAGPRLPSEDHNGLKSEDSGVGPLAPKAEAQLKRAR